MRYVHSPVVLVALSVLVGGCASITPDYDMKFGEAVRQARQSMTLQPAGTALPPTGMDGKAVREATGRYEQSFKAPPPVVNVINIGGTTASGGGR